MPDYGGVKLKLQSQYDSLTIPEFSLVLPPPPPASPRTEDLSPTDSEVARHVPADNVMDVYIPIYHGSQFWVVYSCDEPHDGTRYYYFKLCINGRCLLSWGSGASEGFSGRITYGMYEGPRDFEDKQVIEKRAFFFPPSNIVDVAGGGFEIQVFRAKARRREEAKFETWVGGADGKGICINKAGHVKRWEPRRRYKYALVDPVDQPLVTFRYHCRSGSQLREMNMPLAVPDGDFEDLMKASPSKRDRTPASPMFFSPPPKEKPRPPPKDFAGKDSIALRRASLPPRIGIDPKALVVEESPVKKHQGKGSIDIFDALEGLSLAQPARAKKGLMTGRGLDFHLPMPKKLLKETPAAPPLPESSNNAGFFKRLKKRSLGSRDGGADDAVLMFANQDLSPASASRL